MCYKSYTVRIPKAFCTTTGKLYILKVESLVDTS